MGWVRRTFNCADCGAKTTRNVKNGATWRCRTCGENRAVQAALSMAHRTGQMYDRHREKVSRDLRTDVERWAAERFL